jgi:electron transfer flavoprotein alpha subunit
MPEILVFCDRDEVAFELLSKGKELSQKLNMKLSAAVLGKDAERKVDDYFAYGADKIYLGKDALLSDFYTDVYADALYQISQDYDSEVLLVGSTKRGKTLVSRVAQKLGAGCVADAIGIEISDGNLLVSRYALGGNTVSVEAIKTPKKVISVMPRSCELGAKEPRQGEVINLDLKLREPRVKIIERKEKARESVDLEDAEILVCVGRGLAKKEDLELIQELAKAFKGEIGCTKPIATDYQWLSEDRILGLSGKRCKPVLCVSIGVSGTIQHVVGMRDSKIIVAINKDPKAEIFKITDYGIVGDLYKVIPALTEKVKAL